MLKNKILTIVAVVFGLALPSFAISPANAVDITGTLGSSTANCGSYSLGADPVRVFMIGDSITHRGTDELKALKPNWAISARTGRNVDCLQPIVEERLTGTPTIGKLVIALGTNAVEGWTRADYEAVVNLVSPETVVVFVSTYRDPDLWNTPSGDPYRTQAGTQFYFTNMMEDIAASRPNTFIVPWRQYASNHPQMLTDGVHPNNAGQLVWAQMVADVVGDSWAKPIR